MIVRLACGALQGVDAFRVDLEVDFLRKGMPAFVMVGLAEGAVREAKERVFAAMRSCGFTLPAARITVNLAPADRRKAGSAYDLPLAVALLGAAGVLPAERLEGWFLAGELSLSGAIKPVPGVLPLGMLARNEGAKGIVTAPENASEAALVKGLPAYGPATLDEARGWYRSDLSASRTTQYLMWRWSEAEPIPGPAKFLWPTGECCFSTSCRNTARIRSTCSGSRLRAVR